MAYQAKATAEQKAQIAERILAAIARGENKWADLVGATRSVPLPVGCRRDLVVRRVLSSLSAAGRIERDGKGWRLCAAA